MRLPHFRDVARGGDDKRLAIVFIAFLAYCLQVTLARRLHALAPGLTPRSVLEKFAAVQMIDVHRPAFPGNKPVAVAQIGQLLQHQGEERAEYMAADSGVAGMINRTGGKRLPRGGGRSSGILSVASGCSRRHSRCSSAVLMPLRRSSRFLQSSRFAQLFDRIYGLYPSETLRDNLNRCGGVDPFSIGQTQMPLRVRIAGLLIAAGSFGPAAADQPDGVKAVIPGGPGVLTKCRGWLVTTTCRTYRHISLPSRIAVGDKITVRFGSHPKEFGFSVARIRLKAQHCAIFSKADGGRHRADEINVAPCYGADDGG